MRELINMLVDLDAWHGDAGAARASLAREGFDATVGHGAPDRVLAWIDEIFSGSWSSEALRAENVLVMRGAEPVAFASFDGAGCAFPWLRGAAREPGTGIFGPFGVAPEARGGIAGPSTLTLALDALRERGYRRALIAATNEALVPYYERHAGARVVERFDPRAFAPHAARTVVLASGSGSNFQAVLDHVRTDGFTLDLVALVSNKSDAFALERARAAGVAPVILPWKRNDVLRETYDAKLLECVHELRPDLVLLLGWMHLLAPAFVDAFPQMLNVHPAFLPLDPHSDTVTLPDGSTMAAFRGARAVADACAAGASWVGASVHHVTAQTDRGSIYARKPMRLAPGETAQAALERLHPLEHQTVIGALHRWLYERPS